MTAHRPGGILAADLATVSGHAYAMPPDEPCYGSHRMARPGAPLGDCFVELDRWLNELIDLFQPKVFVFEAPIMIGGRDKVAIVQRLMGLAAIAEMVGQKRGLTVRQASSQTIAKHFTGSARWGGRAERKAAMITACRGYGWAPTDDNQADSLGLLVYAEAKLVPKLAALRTVSAGPLFVLPPAA